MSMEADAMEKERRRQVAEKRRKRRRQRIIKRNLCLLAGLIVGIFLVKWVLSLSDHKTAQEDAIVAMSQKEGSKRSASKQDLNPIDKNKEQEGEETRTSEAIGEGNLVLVNEQHPLRNYDSEKLVSIGSYMEGVCKVKSTEIKLQEEAVKALKEMIVAFNEAQGDNDLTIISGYRDFNSQEALHYQSLINNQGGDDVFVAKPDRSEHHTGLAVDFGLCDDAGVSSDYDGTGIYSWISENSYKYGFVVRYDEKKKEYTGISYEPWHLRYVGQVHAQIMNELDLCLEEYINMLKNYSYYTNPGQGITPSTQGYSIYYVVSQGEITQIPVPQNKPYTISGNNEQGFIVTVDLERK